MQSGTSKQIARARLHKLTLAYIAAARGLPETKYDFVNVAIQLHAARGLVSRAEARASRRMCREAGLA